MRIGVTNSFMVLPPRHEVCTRMIAFWEQAPLTRVPRCIPRALFVLYTTGPLRLSWVCKRLQPAVRDSIHWLNIGSDVVDRSLLSRSSVAVSPYLVHEQHGTWVDIRRDTVAWLFLAVLLLSMIVVLIVLVRPVLRGIQGQANTDKKQKKIASAIMAT